MTTLIIGLGQIGLAVAHSLHAQGISVVATSRSPKPALHPNITHIVGDIGALSVHDFCSAGFGTAELSKIDKIAIIIAPKYQASQQNNNQTHSRNHGQNDKIQAYHACYAAACCTVIGLSQHLPNLQRIVFVSSTSVYGQNSGEIIDMHTFPQPPTSPAAQILLDCERLLHSHFGKHCTIIRPSGIYGCDRLMMIRKASAFANADELTKTVNTWTNRIFDTDLVHIITQALTLAKPLPLYLATDHTPTPLHEVLAFIAAAQGQTLTPTNLPPTTGKRIISNIPKHWLQYPHWQMGYRHILCQTQKSK
ncbi:MAG: NAD-dependent epimerase/dehydratase family protein [Moraxella sp.]|nr:NAD-dependent epimerase/dehydratase family protein [Moraxella sp.]